MSRAVLVAARRSPVAPRNGAFAGLSLHDLAAPVVRAALEDAGLAPDRVNEIVVANSLGAGGNPARSVALASDLPERVAGLTIDRQCAGGLDALLLAAAMVRSGVRDVVLAGGVESYSRRPLRLRTYPDGRAPEPYDQAQFTPWPDRDPDMAEAADRLAMTLGIERAEQDAWAVGSHERARRSADLRQPEIAPLAGLADDSFTRALTPALCARAPVVAGSVTAANMAVAADAAAFVVVTSEDAANRMGLPFVVLRGGATLGGDPVMPGVAPVEASRAALEEAGLSIADLTSAEIMEAFAVQAIACQRGLGLPDDIVNPDGGALARGHPIGASGAILAVALFHRLVREGGTGLAAIAAAGGLGTALVASAG